jgi:tetratricopeptide (TPR) repeat protein
MKATSRKKPVLLPHPFAEEKPLDRKATISIHKAGLYTCLFLLLAGSGLGQSTPAWLTREPYREAYNLCLELKLDAARSLLTTLVTPESYAIQSLADMLELMLSEDKSRYDVLEPEYQKRLEALKKINPATEHSLTALAEMRMHWSFVYLKFGHDFNAAWNLRQAHLHVQECQKKFPSAMPVLKAAGILEIMLGSVPERYQWVLGVLGMKGSVELGLSQLAEVASHPPLEREASLLRILLDGFILQETDSAIQAIELLHFENPDNRLILFLGGALAIKNASGEMAMNMLEKLKRLPAIGQPIVYADYLLGEVYLHQGNYPKAIRAYQVFLDHYAGINFVKDAHFKRGMAYWLNNQSADAIRQFDQARATGQAVAEADKYAARALAEQSLPNIPLTRARYATDGGYYDEAIRILRRIKPEELPSAKDQTEYAYRFGRLYHQIDQLETAKKYYGQTIELNGDKPWYFAPNSCLQLGYIYADENDPVQAKKYFTRALSYKKHEYKNSIDSKAKSALEKLKRNQ